VVVGGTEKTPSNAVTVTRDTTAPEVIITSPAPGQLVSGADVTVRGEAEADATIQVRNETSGITSSGLANSSGQYSINISLRNGINVISVTATDGCGKLFTHQCRDHNKRLSWPCDARGESWNNLLE